MWLIHYRRSLVLTLAIAAAAVCGRALANDSIAHLATGGLVLGTTDDIEMRAEDLYVSPTQVRVRYRFFNRSDNDITTRVAFPLPDLTGIREEDYALPTEEVGDNFLAFRTTVDGRAVATEIEQKAFANGADRTQLLRDNAIPLAPQLSTTAEAVEKLPEATKHEFLHQGLVSREQEDLGAGLRDYYYPGWSLRTTYHWQQTFLAKAETIIEHAYRPSVGEMVDTGIDKFSRADLRDDQARRYCIDRGFVEAAKRARKRLPEDGYLREKTIEYILKTAAGWAGPIRDFRLVVDKGSTQNLVSFCAEGVRKISPTQFEVRKADFVPSDNLDILLLVPFQASEEETQPVTDPTNLPDQRGDAGADRPPYPQAILEDMEKAFHGERRVTLEPGFASRPADLNADGVNDYFLDYGKADCEGSKCFCGSGGCSLTVFVSAADDSWTRAGDFLVFDYEIIRNGEYPILRLNLGGASCGKPNYQSCQQDMSWNGDRLVQR